MPSKEVHGGTLHLAIASNLKSLNWLLENSVDVSAVQNLVHMGVAARDYDQPERWVPSLAHSVTRSDDDRVYTVRLRDGVVWQDPALAKAPMYAWARGRTEPLGARDFKLYFDMVTDERVCACTTRTSTGSWWWTG